MNAADSQQTASRQPADITRYYQMWQTNKITEICNYHVTAIIIFGFHILILAGHKRKVKEENVMTTGGEVQIPAKLANA